MRIAVGALMQETNTFVTTTTDLSAFASQVLLHGDEILTGYGTARLEVPAFLDVLRAEGVEVIPTIAANAVAGGRVTRAAFNALVNDLVDGLQAALPLDGVLLALHGAMVTEDAADAERVILRAVREVVGGDVPIAATLDLHGHITPAMIAQADILVGYQRYPHTDMYETGARAAALLLETLRGGIRPVLALAKRPMIVSPVAARTDTGPLRHIAQIAAEMERTGRALHASVYPAQPWLDVPDLGFAALVMTDGDPAAAQSAADQLADLAWSLRGEFEPELVSIDAAIRIGLASDGVTVVGDAGDAPTGGTAADNPAVLRALLDHQAQSSPRPVYVALRDASAVRQAAAAGVGARVSLRVGHSVSVADGDPVEIEGQVLSISDGVYRAEAGSGAEYHMGQTAVIGLGVIRLCLRSLPALEWDPAMYSSQGLDPGAAALIFVKSPSHFRASFAPIAARVLVADTPGATCANMRRLVFKHVTRPLYPLDEDAALFSFLRG